MRIEEIDVGRLNEAAYNPRVKLFPGDPQYEALKKSLTEVGVAEPIVWNERTGNVVGGHLRLRIMKANGAETAPVSVVNLSERDEKALNLALNKITGAWDTDKLRGLLDSLDEDLLATTGYTEREKDIICGRALPPTEPGEEAPVYIVDEFSLVLKFKNRDTAVEWMAEKNIPGQPRASSTFAMVFMGEGDE